MHLTNFPAGQTLVIDANCVIYHLTGTYASCTQVFERALRREIVLVTSAAITSEVHHRLMTLAAVRHSTRPIRNVAAFLKAHPDVIRESTECRATWTRLKAFPIRILPVTKRLVWEAERLSHEIGLLTTDALLVATIRTARLTHLATNDTDFLQVPGLTVWRP